MSKQAKANKRNRRQRLYEQQQGLCYWCKALMVLPTDSGPQALNVATFDHVYPKNHASRSKFRENIKKPHPVVLACWSCNNDRGATPFFDYSKQIQGTAHAET